MSREAVKRKLTALLSADVAGYSRLMAMDEAATLERLTAHRGLIGGLVRQHGGRVVNAVGDNLLADFPSAVDAVVCAVAFQRELRERNAKVSDRQKLQFRVGIHLGDVMIEGASIYGDGVNIAARLEALAKPGGICISGTMHEIVRNKLSNACEDIGERTLKNIPHPVRVYRVHPTEGGGPDEAAALTVPGFAGRPAIAVLPFDNLSGDPEQEYFADGMVDDLITRLSALRLLPVIARNSSFVYKGKPVDVKRVSSELGVRYLVEGSVRKSDTRVRISAQLIEATTGAHVWAHSYDRELRDLFAVQDEIVQALVVAIEPALQHVERQRALGAKPATLGAWERMQRGAWHMLRYTRQDLIRARTLFGEAIELDPLCARAHSFLADSLCEELTYQWADSPSLALADALAAAQRAMALDEDDPIAHSTFARVCTYAAQYERSIAACERALELNPSSSVAYTELGVALTMGDRPHEAIGLLVKALRLAPRGASTRGVLLALGLAHFAAGEYTPAVAWLKKSLASRPDQPQCYGLLAASCGHLGHVEDARNALDQLFHLSPHFSLALLASFVPRPLFERYLDGWRKAGWKDRDQR